MAKQKNRNRSIPHITTQDHFDGGGPLKPTPASAWVSSVAGHGYPLPLPSGNVALVKRVGMEAFMAQGIIPDPLTPIITKAINSKKGLRPQDTKQIVTDPKMIGAMLEMADRIAVNAVIEPKMSMPPECTVCGEQDTPRNAQHNDANLPEFHKHSPGPRETGVVYVDMVDLEDKMHIMNFAVGGTSDLKQFREQLGTSMGRMATQQSTEG